LKEEKKDDDKDVGTEGTEIEQPEKKARLDETEEDTSAVEQNGIVELQSESMDDDEIEEIKADVPIIDIADEELKAIDSEDSLIADTVAVDSVNKNEEVVAETEPEPAKESPTPAAKTTPTRGRGGGRGRGVARRGRSSR